MDKRPIRRKYKDNPYKLESIEKENKYIIKFKDINGSHAVIVKKEVFDIFDKEEKYENKILTQHSRYIEHIDLSDNEISKRASNKEESVEDIVISKLENEKLQKAIQQLPENQKRRLRKYYFDGKTQQEIADEENVNIRAIQYTLQSALSNLKRLLK